MTEEERRIDNVRKVLEQHTKPVAIGVTFTDLAKVAIKAYNAPLEPEYPDKVVELAKAMRRAAWLEEDDEEPDAWEDHSELVREPWLRNAETAFAFFAQRLYQDLGYSPGELYNLLGIYNRDYVEKLLADHRADGRAQGSDSLRSEEMEL